MTESLKSKSVIDPETSTIQGENLASNPNSNHSTYKGKIFRDPLHDLIEVECPIAFKIINSEAFQRLREIRQLGLAYLVYPGAEHSRFTHSIGAFHIANQVVQHINEKSLNRTNLPFDDFKKKLVTLSALVHDIGHGAFSHLFEHISKKLLPQKYIDHEKWTQMIVCSNSEISTILKEVEGLQEKMLEVCNKSYKPHYVVELISSQLDVDRFDYLLRDSLMTGAKDSNFDLPWIINNLKVEKHTDKDIEIIAIDGRRGTSAVDKYILGRYFMYKQVYLHKTIRAAERMLLSILMRIVDLVKDKKLEPIHPIFLSFAKNEPPSLEDYLSVTDFKILTWIDELSSSSDSILKDLCARFKKRMLFGAIVLPKMSKSDYFSKLSELQKLVSSEGFDHTYYALEDVSECIAYKDLSFFQNTSKEERSAYEEIYYLDSNGKVCQFSLSTNSVIAQSKASLVFEEERWYVPKEIIEKAYKLVYNK